MEWLSVPWVKGNGERLQFSAVSVQADGVKQLRWVQVSEVVVSWVEPAEAKQLRWVKVPGVRSSRLLWGQAGAAPSLSGEQHSLFQMPERLFHVQLVPGGGVHVQREQARCMAHPRGPAHQEKG